MNFCPNCGAKIAENAKFCAGCGQPLAEATKSTNKTAEDNIHSADNDEDELDKELEEAEKILRQADSIDIEEPKTEDECEFEDEELAATEEDNPAKEENTETGTLSGWKQRKLAIDQFLRTRKDYSKMTANKILLSFFLSIVLSLVCTGIVFIIVGAIVGWILFDLCGLDLDNWSRTANIIVGLGILYALWKVFKWFFGFFNYLFISHFGRNFVDKYADEICATLPVSKRDIRLFCEDDDCILDLMTEDVSSIKPKSKPKQKSNK